MTGRLSRLAPRAARFGRRRVLGWRTGSRQSQLLALLVLLLGVAASLGVSLQVYSLMPVTAYFLWLLLGMMLLRFRPLVVLVAVTTVCGSAAVLLDGAITPVRISGLIAFLAAGALILYQSSRQRSGLPAVLSEALLADLRDRLQAQGAVPALPAGWTCQSATIAAHGVGYAGDFLIADLRDDRHLELILVDVCGHGVSAGPQALQFAGALGGLIGALPPVELFGAANAFLLRQVQDIESFATAVHVLLDLEDGTYGIVSAGHPPALHWDDRLGEWCLDGARGTALGLVPRPELHTNCGRLAPGDALMFYTDGVVETRSASLDDGIEWLRETARRAVQTEPGFAGAAQRIIRSVDRGEDDRAVLILHRGPTG